MKQDVLLRKIGKRIREVRLQKGLTQQELAALVDVEKSNMSRLEAGKTNPTIVTLNKIANAVNLTLSELLSM